MVKRSKQDKENETFENQILKRLDDVEKRINERISSVETSLKRIDESSILATDDQLFFGFVFSTALLMLTLPELDISTLFESFGLKIEATHGILTTKDIVFFCLIIASILRYLVIFVKEIAKKNKMRSSSVSFVFASFYMLMMDLFLRGVVNVLKNLHWLLIVFAPVLFILLTVLFSLLEKKWYQRYYNFSEPIVSLAFAFLGLFVVVAYVLSMFITLLIPFSDIVNTTFGIIASIIITVLLYLLSLRVGEKLTRKKKPC